MKVDIHRRSDFYNVVWLAWPQALSMLVITLQSMVDMFWIGRLGTESVAAVSICGNIINVIFGVSGILHVGTIAIISRAKGSGDERQSTQAFAHSFLLGFFLGAVILAVCYGLAPWIVGFFKASTEVTRLSIIYLRIMSVHIMIILLFISLAATFAASGDTFTPLVINSIAVFLNIILDPVFIFSRGEAVDFFGWVIHPGLLGWGIFGAGMASVVAVVLALLLYLLTIPMKRFPVYVPRPGKVEIALSEFWRIISIGVPFAIAHVSRPLTTVLLLRIISGFGTGAVAGFGIAMRWYSVNWILLGGLGAAASVLVGQYLGATSKEGASRVSKRIIIASFVLQVFSTALYCYFAPLLISMMDPNPLSIEPGAAFMRWVVLGFLFSSPGGICAAAMNGAGDTKPGMIAGVVSNWIVKLPLCWFLARESLLGLDGVWIGMFISLVVEGVMMLIWYSRGKWKEKII